MPKKKTLSLKEQRVLFEDNLLFLKAALSKYFKNNYHVMGIDPSLSNTAIAVNRVGWKKILFFNSPETIRDLKLKRSAIHRISLTRDYLVEKIKKFPSFLTVIEGYSYGSMQARELMGEVGGMIRLNGFFDNPKEVGPVIVVVPSQLKKYILGSAQTAGGKKTKQLIILNVFKTFGIEAQNDNEADAIVLVKIGMDLVRFAELYGDKTFDGDKEIRDFINNGWQGSEFPKYRWEVLCTLIINKCKRDSMFEFYNENNI